MTPCGLRILITSDAVGGVWTYSLAVAGAYVTRGAAATIAVVGPAPSAVQRLACARAGVDLVPLDGPLDWMASQDRDLDVTRASILEVARKSGADVIQTHAPALNPADCRTPVLSVVHSCLATWWAAVHPHAAPPAQFAWHAAATAAGLARAAQVIAPSHGFAHALRKVYGTSADRMKVVHNGIAGCARPPAETLRDLVVASGRVWDEGKNLRSLDAVAAHVGWPIWVAGSLESPSGGVVRLDACRTLGEIPRAAMDDLLRDRPIFVSPSLYEPFGLAVLEAASAACPLVVADTPTMRELWADAALFADPRDPAAFAGAINLLIDDAAERQRLALAARARSRTYTLERTAMALLQAATKIAGAPAMAAAS